MYDTNDYIGRRGIVMHAIGGVDIALWDLAGQAAGKPVYDLLGGKKRDRIPVYGTIYPLARDPAEVAAQIIKVRAMNLRAFKFCADPWWMDDLDNTATLLRAARAEAGDDTPIIVDAALSYKTVEEGLRLLPILKDAGILFLEAPLPLDDLAGHAAMAGRGMPIGVGDLGLTHVDEFIDFMDRGGADICQPDITMVGGVTGIRRIADAARDRGKRLVPHAYKTNIEIAANTHFMSAYPEPEMMEWPTSKSPLRWNTTKEHLPVEPDGTVIVPDRPGLGVTLDWKFVTENRWSPK
jgi:L-alanine-DL-glutamate epimerase-like enolase superfamily enzyme